MQTTETKTVLKYEAVAAQLERVEELVKENQNVK